MVASPTAFPQRRRRPSPSSFISPKLSPTDLLRSLHSLATEIANLSPPSFLFKRSSTSIIRKCLILSIIFEEIIRSKQSKNLSPSSSLCFEEMFIVLQRVKAIIEDCSGGSSKFWILMQTDSISSGFHELTMDLWTLLEIMPEKELHFSEDLRELRDFVIKQCRREKRSVVETQPARLRVEVLSLLNSIKREIVPDQIKLNQIFTQLGLSDSASCEEEAEFLQDEVQCQNDEKSRSEVVALIGLVRYAKCVLFGASSPTYADSISRRNSLSEANIPSDFRCPITLELMADPVVVSTGQTYDRTSILLWIESGHNTCPKTGQNLAHTNLIPNRALKSLIAMWCRERRIPYLSAGEDTLLNSGVSNKAALEATRMTVSFLLGKLAGLESGEDVNRILYELRVLAKTDSNSRAWMGEAGAIPLLVRYLGPENTNVQVNAVTTILNLSILESNKGRIMETDGALNGVIEVLRSGATWEAKANAAATVFSLSGVSAYRKRLGRKTRVVKGLLELAREGSASSKRDALVAILTLAGDREIAGRLVEGGVVDTIKLVMEELPEEAMTILETVVKKGGFVAVAAASHLIGRLVAVLRSGTDRAKESAIATLVIICRKGGAEMVAELAKVSTIEMVIWELMGTGTARAKRKAASLMRILRRWAAGLEGDVLEEFSMTMALQ